jgi:hypothetical protein
MTDIRGKGIWKGGTWKTHIRMLVVLFVVMGSFLLLGSGLFSFFYEDDFVQGLGGALFFCVFGVGMLIHIRGLKVPIVTPILLMAEHLYSDKKIRLTEEFLEIGNGAKIFLERVQDFKIYCVFIESNDPENGKTEAYHKCIEIVLSDSDGILEQIESSKSLAKSIEILDEDLGDQLKEGNEKLSIIFRYGISPDDMFGPLYEKRNFYKPDFEIMGGNKYKLGEALISILEKLPLENNK